MSLFNFLSKSSPPAEQASSLERTPTPSHPTCNSPPAGSPTDEWPNTAAPAIMPLLAPLLPPAHLVGSHWQVSMASQRMSGQCARPYSRSPRRGGRPRRQVAPCQSTAERWTCQNFCRDRCASTQVPLGHHRRTLGACQHCSCLSTHSRNCQLAHRGPQQLTHRPHGLRAHNSCHATCYSALRVYAHPPRVRLRWHVHSHSLQATQRAACRPPPDLFARRELLRLRRQPSRSHPLPIRWRRLPGRLPPAPRTGSSTPTALVQATTAGWTAVRPCRPLSRAR